MANHPSKRLKPTARLRPRLQTEEKTGRKFYTTMLDVCEDLQIPVSEVQRAKKSSDCLAFYNSKIYHSTLVTWLAANPKEEVEVGQSTDVLRDRKLKAQVDKLELEVAVERGNFVAKAAVTQQWGKLITDIFDIVDKSVDRTTYNAIAKELKNRLGHK